MVETTWAYYERLHRESCLREEQLKQQLESMTNERNELRSIKELCLWSNQILEINKLNEQLKESVEVIEMISVYDRVPTPCPDNKEGCLVAHFKKGNGAIIADQFLAKYRGGEMSDYMIQKADDQIEAGLNERESLLQELAKLKAENEKLRKTLFGCHKYIKEVPIDCGFVNEFLALTNTIEQCLGNEVLGE